MGIFNALSSAVSGMKAQANSLENISGNIANTQTTGYKRVDTSFADLVPFSAATASAQPAGSVIASSRATNTVQGTISSSEVDTHVAVTGDGYFLVSDRVGSVDNTSIFSDQTLYTRRGDFVLDREGYLVNGGGYYLQTLELDPTTGNPVGSAPELRQFQEDFIPATETSTVEYRLNLPSYPSTSDTDTDVVDSELYDITGLTDTGGTAYSPLPVADGGDGYVLSQHSESFVENSISGGAITVYDANGTPANVQIRWAKTSNSPETWNAFYLEDSNAAADAVEWRNFGQQYQFDADGQLSAGIGTSVTLPANPVFDGTALTSVTINHGSQGVTQFDDPNGTSTVTSLSQNGSPSGELLSINIGDSGVITAFYSNGQSQPIAQIPLASFNADDQLGRLDGGAFTLTSESGSAMLGATGDIVGSALESSNTDIGDEFSKMIVTQQAYTANSRVITTADELLQETLNIVR